jgi:hypothetical protein
VVALPAVAALVSLACALVLARDARRRPTSDKIAWIIAFALFSVAAGAEVAGSLLGWSETMVRVYYLAGAMLVVGFLGLGELYLLAPGRVARVGPGIALFMMAIAAALVVGAPIDVARMPAEGWHALERGPALIAATVTLNVAGTVIVVGGAAYSAWQFWRRGIFRHRMIGCLLIAVGTLIVASGGTLTRLGRPEYLYIAMAIGVSVIFAGYLEARRREVPAAPAAGRIADVSTRTAGSPAPAATNGHAGAGPAVDPGVAFLVGMLVQGAADEVAERCRFWSVEPEPITRFDREQARRVWSVRLRLPAAAQVALDQLPAATQLQVADLYREVLAPGAEATGTATARLPRPSAN